MLTPIENFLRNGGQKKLTDYPLKSSSVVFDVGGYLGGWTAELLKEKCEVCKYCGVKQDPHIYVFEPVKEFYEQCVYRFLDFPKVQVFNVALGGHDHEAQVTVDGSATGVYSEKGYTENIYIRDIAGFIYDKGIQKIDLISINIEGGEYDLIGRMIDSDIHKICDNIQVQFHKINGDSEYAVGKIHRRLRDTHQKVMDYPFVWESWKKNT